MSRKHFFYVSSTAKYCVVIMRVNPPTLLVRSIQVFFRQYAEGHYAVRKNPVISYADINFFLKGAIFIKKNTTNVTLLSKKKP